jgi:hypothetical protein
VPQFIQSCNVKTMSKTRLNIRRQLILFERLESDKRLAVLYQALLEHKYAEQLELEEAESRDLTEEERQAQEAELLAEQINELNFTNKEILFLLKSTGIVDLLTQKFVTSSKVSKVISLFVKRSAKTLEIDLNRRKTKEEFCLYDKEENDLVAKLYSLRSVGMPLAVIQHFINWNIENKGLPF